MPLPTIARSRCTPRGGSAARERRAARAGREPATDGRRGAGRNGSDADAARCGGRRPRSRLFHRRAIGRRRRPGSRPRRAAAGHSGVRSRDARAGLLCGVRPRLTHSPASMHAWTRCTGAAMRAARTGPSCRCRPRRSTRRQRSNRRRRRRWSGSARAGRAIMRCVSAWMSELAACEPERRPHARHALTLALPLWQAGAVLAPEQAPARVPARAGRDAAAGLSRPP